MIEVSLTPADYVCLFCCLVQEIEHEHNQLRPSDIVHQNKDVTALMDTRRFPRNPGHVLVIPNQHFENIYDRPLHLANNTALSSGYTALSRGRYVFVSRA